MEIILFQSRGESHGKLKMKNFSSGKKIMIIIFCFRISANALAIVTFQTFEF